ncbi:MAG: TetR family transcriptional regulator C-terminal domain-containing protein, partial [Verrucomicrobiota bacterium]
DRTGPVRDALASSVTSWQAAVRRAVEQAQDENHLVREVDPLQVAFENRSPPSAGQRTTGGFLL